MSDIGSLFDWADPAVCGVTLTRAESDTVPTDNLPDPAEFPGQVRRDSCSRVPVLGGGVLDDRAAEGRIRRTDSQTQRWMARGGG